MMRIRLPLYLALLVLFINSAFAADNGTVVRKADLKDKPSFSAKTVAKMPPNTPLSILKRQGGWFEVEIPNQNFRGWVRMLSVRLGTVGAAAKGDSGLKSLFKFARTGNSGTTTVATGVRGLSEKQIKNAKPNPAELSRMQSFAANKKTAKGFAKQVKLKKKSVPHLPDPRKNNG